MVSASLPHSQCPALHLAATLVKSDLGARAHPARRTRSLRRAVRPPALSADDTPRWRGHVTGLESDRTREGGASPAHTLSDKRTLRLAESRQYCQSSRTLLTDLVGDARQNEQVKAGSFD